LKKKNNKLPREKRQKNKKEKKEDEAEQPPGAQLLFSRSAFLVTFSLPVCVFVRKNVQFDVTDHSPAAASERERNEPATTFFVS